MGRFKIKQGDGNFKKVAWKDEVDAVKTYVDEKIKTDVPANAEFTDTVTPIVDNLTSVDVDKALSAQQGKVLKDELAEHKEDYTNQRAADNLKVATVEKGLNDYKSTMANVNVNQEAKQKISGYGTISLPKNSANGQANISLKGNTIIDETGTKSTVSASRLKSVDSEGNNANELYLPNVGELRSLPNGVKDEVRVSGGKAEHIKRVSNEVVLNGALTWGTVDTSTHPDVYSSAISNWGIGRNILYDLDNTGIGRSADSDYVIRKDGVNFRAIRLRGSLNGIQVYIEKSKINLMAGSNILEQFKNYLNLYPLTLTYQLANEIVTPIQTSGNLISYPSGTVYVENVVADAGIYTTKFDIKDMQLPIKSIDKLIKYNFETGVQTVLDATLAVINADKKSFTHPNLTNKDMVFVDYFYDVEGTLGETTIEYLDSRHTIKDTTNNKFYSWNIKSTNGVPTVNLTEVL